MYIYYWAPYLFFALIGMLVNSFLINRWKEEKPEVPFTWIKIAIKVIIMVILFLKFRDFENKYLFVVLFSFVNGTLINLKNLIKKTKK